MTRTRVSTATATATTLAADADADFVRTATLHRDARLARAHCTMKGPNTLLPGDTIYLFQCPAEGEFARVFAITIPDALVEARDAEGVRRTFLERDADYDAGGPWWIKPLGVTPADLPAGTPAADIRPAAIPRSPTETDIYFG